MVQVRYMPVHHFCSKNRKVFLVNPNYLERKFAWKNQFPGVVFRFLLQSTNLFSPVNF